MTILYTNNCPKCKVLKQKLDAKQILYEVCEDVETMMDKGFRSTPVLDVNGKIMTFLDAVEWIKGE